MHCTGSISSLGAATDSESETLSAAIIIRAAAAAAPDSDDLSPEL